MQIINLKDIYPDYYYEDYMIEVPSDVAELFRADQLAEKAAERKKYRHKAHYSLDRGDGIENSVLFVAMTPDELYEKKLTNQQLYAAISQLPEKQAKRIYAYFFMNMDEPAIAKSEGVSQQAVHHSIQRGLANIGNYLKKLF